MADHDPTTVDLLARALRDTDGWLTGPHSNPTAYYVAAAERIRTALTAEGRLLPEGGQTGEEWLPADEQVSAGPLDNDGYQYAVEDPPGTYHVYGDQSWVRVGHVIRDGSHPDGRIVRPRVRVQVGRWEVPDGD